MDLDGLIDAVATEFEIYHVTCLRESDEYSQSITLSFMYFILNEFHEKNSMSQILEKIKEVMRTAREYCDSERNCKLSRSILTSKEE